MALLGQLDFANKNLMVSYRASAAPQLLDVSLTIREPTPHAEAPKLMRALVDQINYGAAGSDEFSPSLGRARVLSGPLEADRDDAKGPEYSWQLETTGVSTRFIRNMVELLRGAGIHVPVTSMAILGAVPVDGGPLSLSEDKLRGWLDDPTAYPRAWTRPGFSIRRGDHPTGALVRIKLRSHDSKRLVDEFRQALGVWSQAISNYGSLRGRGAGNMQRHAQIVAGPTELVARFDRFEFVHDPACDMLVNVLTRFHEKVAALSGAEIELCRHPAPNRAPPPV